MWSWLTDHSGALSALVNFLMAGIWLAYLQLFLISFHRSNRAVVHIGMADESGGDARCIVSNMGANVVYVIAVLVDFDREEGAMSAIVTDRVEQDAPDADDYRQRTNQGPLAGGDSIDIGTFRKLAERVSRNTGDDVSLDACTAITVTVAIAAQQAQAVRGGYKRFDMERDKDGQLRFISQDLLTRQIKGRGQRKKLEAMIADQGGGGSAARR